MSTSETGHARNVANFYEQISFITGYGAAYNPSKVSLQLPSLIAKYTEALNSLQGVTATFAGYTTAVNARLLPFEELGAYATRLVNALDATDASHELVKDAKGLLRKLRGRRAKPLQPMQPGDPIPNNISVSQRSYDQKLETFTNLVALVQSEPSYAPNETDLQATAMQDKITELHALNNGVTDAWTIISNARLERNVVLYHPETGMLAIAQESKNYVRSVFGAKAPETKQLTAIRYKKIKP